MSDAQDYSKYTFKELKEAYYAIDRPAYPDRFKAIVIELKKRKVLCDRSLKSAQAEYNSKGNLPEVIELFQKIADAYPGTVEAKKARGVINRGTRTLPTPVTAAPGIQKQDMNLEFRGAAGEYFRIWIVNLCLTLLTLGIFSAWAKVRKKRYFYAHLILDGTPFQYLAKPIPILKGRIIAAILFLLYYSSSHVFTALFPYVAVAGLVLAPWVIVRSVAFNARYSAFRNMTFYFDGTYVEAFRVISAWGFIPAIVLGTLFNWWGKFWLAGILYGGFSIVFPFWMRRLKHFIVTRTAYGGQFGQFRASGGDFFGVYFVSGLIVFGFAILTVITAMVSTRVFNSLSPTSGFLFVIPIYTGYVIAYAYLQAKLTNTMWNKMSLGPLGFSCTLKSMDMLKLYLTNAIGIIFSAGLLIPWAVIRTFRYRATHTRVTASSVLDTFHGSHHTNVQAAGAELTEFFDLDLSL